MPVIITIDDYIPISLLNESPALTTTESKCLWSLLLEKAYTKLYDSEFYRKKLDPSHVIRDLTGLPI